MSHGVFIVALTLVVIAAVVVMYAMMRMAGLDGDEPTEHGDGEP